MHNIPDAENVFKRAGHVGKHRVAAPVPRPRLPPERVAENY